MKCIKTLKKVPLAALGLMDLIASGADKAICTLAKRGEKAIKKMEKHKCCACGEENTTCEHP